VVQNAKASLPGTQGLFVKHDKFVPTRTKITTAAILVFLELSRERFASTGKRRRRKVDAIPIYFASEALSGSKLFYSKLEKVAYAVVMAARKLRHCFEGHRIRVIMNQPLNELFTNKEAPGRITKWVAELSEYTTYFERRSAIKSQVLADFVVNWTSPTVGLDENIQTH
jgi:hypothetical protein